MLLLQLWIELGTSTGANNNASTQPLMTTTEILTLANVSNALDTSNYTGAPVASPSGLLTTTTTTTTTTTIEMIASV